MAVRTADNRPIHTHTQISFPSTILDGFSWRAPFVKNEFAMSSPFFQVNSKLCGTANIGIKISSFLPIWICRETGVFGFAG
jgi:hypothetical protein